MRRSRSIPASPSPTTSTSKPGLDFTFAHDRLGDTLLHRYHEPFGGEGAKAAREQCRGPCEGGAIEVLTLATREHRTGQFRVPVLRAEVQSRAPREGGMGIRGGLPRCGDNCRRSRGVYVSVEVGAARKVRTADTLEFDGARTTVNRERFAVYRDSPDLEGRTRAAGRGGSAGGAPGARPFSAFRYQA